VETGATAKGKEAEAKTCRRKNIPLNDVAWKIRTQSSIPSIDRHRNQSAKQRKKLTRGLVRRKGTPLTSSPTKSGRGVLRGPSKSKHSSSLGGLRRKERGKKSEAWSLDLMSGGLQSKKAGSSRGVFWEENKGNCIQLS